MFLRGHTREARHLPAAEERAPLEVKGTPHVADLANGLTVRHEVVEVVRVEDRDHAFPTWMVTKLMSCTRTS
jgi:hypothetical protein